MRAILSGRNDRIGVRAFQGLVQALFDALRLVSGFDANHPQDCSVDLGTAHQLIVQPAFRIPGKPELHDGCLPMVCPQRVVQFEC
jgi:hypothetical protein